MTSKNERDVKSTAWPSKAEKTLTTVVDALGGARREGQIAMTKAVEKAMYGRRHLAVQAGTGTGKSLAYIIPSILHAQRTGETVIISTATLALQRQLIARDLPRIADALAEDLPFTFAILKGRNNYLCRYKLAAGAILDAEQPAMWDERGGPSVEATALDDLAVASVEDEDGAGSSDGSGDSNGNGNDLSTTAKQVQYLYSWADETETGDRDDLTATISDEAWNQLSVTSRTCVGANQCPFAAECFAEMARDRAAQADIIVTNHALLAIDAMSEAEVLPAHSVVVIDEAHELDPRITSVATEELYAPGLKATARRVKKYDSELSSDLHDAADSFSDWLDSTPEGRWDDLPSDGAQVFARLHLAARAARLAIASAPTTQDSAELTEHRTVRAALEDIEATCVRIATAAGVPLADPSVTALDVEFADIFGDNSGRSSNANGIGCGTRMDGGQRSDNEDEEVGLDDIDERDDVSGYDGIDDFSNLVDLDGLDDDDNDGEQLGGTSNSAQTTEGDAAGGHSGRGSAGRGDNHNGTGTDDQSAHGGSASSGQENSRLVGISGRDVIWKEERPRSLDAALCVAPLSVAPLLATRLFAQATVILTSATLALGGRFDAMASQWGLARGTYDDLDVGTPFDAATHGILYVADDAPIPGRESSRPEVFERMCRMIEAAGGRTLALFSSRRAAEDAAAYARDRLDVPVLCQGESSITQLVQKFRDDEETCLFGTLTLWQGVDVPGPSLSLVIIDRIPFPRPGDPLSTARSQAATEAGRNGFMEVSATHAALLMAQGAGRLLRSVDDRGVVAVMDPRLRTKSYGSFILASLPRFWTTTNLEATLGALRRLTGQE